MKTKAVFANLLTFSTSMLGLGLGFSNGVQGLMPSAQAKEIEDKAKEQFVCTAANLSGKYGVLANGYLVFVNTQSGIPGVSNIPVGPVASIGRLTVDGAKNTVSVALKDNFNGSFVPSTKPFAEYQGSFSLNNSEDCTGEFEIVNTIGKARFTFVVVNQGREIQFMRTGGTLDDAGVIRTVITGTAKKQ